jgi:Cu(I)-responsive transcriptional regulator
LPSDARSSIAVWGIVDPSLNPNSVTATPSHHWNVKGFSFMNIGAAATATGVSAKMIRHYEAIGLLRAAARRANAYRDYGEHEIHELRFVRRARRLGFSIDEIAALLALWRDKERPSRKVRKIALSRVEDLEMRIVEMQAMAATLRKLVHDCHGDDRPECPILEDLETGEAEGCAAAKAIT